MIIALPTASEIEASLGAWRRDYPQLQALLARIDPPAALRHLGLWLWSEGNAPAAASVLMAAAALAPQEAAIWNDLGGALCAAGRLNEAKICIAESLERNPKQPGAWVFLGLLHDQLLELAEAERAFLRALEQDPCSAAASRGLGFLYFRQRRFEAAAERLRAAACCGGRDVSLDGCLAQALFHIGDFSGAAALFAAQAKQDPDPNLVRKLALLRMVESLIGGSVADALSAYRDAAGPHAEDAAKAALDAFHLLSAYGHREVAIRIGRARLESAPDDPVQRYLLAALEGKAVDRAPADYVRMHFDQFAEEFDRRLVDILGYAVPEKLSALLVAERRHFPRVLDLGCGTGLAGPLLRPLAASLTGLDLSPRMLAKAAERCVYDELIESDAVSFLDRGDHAFDLIVATDVLIYFGDLSPLMGGIAKSLRSGAWLAFSIETSEAPGYTVLPSGRFAHSLSYVDDVSRQDFKLIHSTATTIRLEANRPVAGALFVMERR